MTLTEASTLYLDALATNFTAPSTLKKYRRTLRFLAAGLGDPELASITATTITAYRTTRKLGPNAAAKELQIIKSFFRWLHEQGHIPANPAATLRPPRVRLAEKVPFTSDEVIRILAACDRIGQEPYERRRAKAAMLLMRYTGLRISDVIFLRRDAIKDGVLQLRTQKTKQFVLHDLNVFPVVLGVLESLPHGGEHYFWNGSCSREAFMSTMQRALHSVYLRSGVQGAHNHRWRHTYASQLLSTGASLWYVAKKLGITAAMCEKVYGHLTADFARQDREAIARAFVESQEYRHPDSTRTAM